MSTSHALPSPTTRDDPVPPGSTAGAGRVQVTATALALGAGTVIAMLLWNPWPARDELSYGAVSPVRDDTWLGLALDGAGLAVAALAMSLAVCFLAQRRGAVWATVGSVLTSLGGLLFAMGAFAFAALSWYATATGALPEPSGRELMRYAEDNPGHVMGLQMAGFLLFTIGVVVLSTALLRAATVPRWLPVGLLVLTVVEFAPVPGRVLDLVQVAFMALLVALAWLLVARRGGRPRR